MSVAVEQVVKPYHQSDRFALYEGDCRSVLPIFADEYFDSIVTDPPYELGFMGKGWDRSGIAYDVSVWRECLRVLKPGGHLLAFGGSRTYHRLACAIEDAGFEIRDQIQWIYGSGFPKSLDVSKQIDLMEKNVWENIKQTLAELDHGVIIEAWNRTLLNAELVQTPSLKNHVAVGFNTQRSGSVPVNAPQPINPKRLPFNVIIAELQYCEALPLSGVNTTSAHANADINMAPSQAPAVSVERLLQNPSLKLFITASIAQCGVRASLNERAAVSLTAGEALKIWLGKKKCLEAQDINALCAGLIDGLRLTILSQSKTFQNLDTQSQTECVSAMTVTTTASTAASLISFTVDTLRNVAIDAAAGAERQVVGVYRSPENTTGFKSQNSRAIKFAGESFEDGLPRPVSAPATDAAKQWDGWGTALKPAHEPIVLARKPLIGNVAENVLQHGTGGLNIDGCRIETVDNLNGGAYAENAAERHDGRENWRFRNGGGRQPLAGDEREGAALGMFQAGKTVGSGFQQPIGRWPANVIHDGSDEVLAGFPETETNAGMAMSNHKAGLFGVETQQGRVLSTGNGGSAARFFYCPKADNLDRNDGLEDLPTKSAGEVTDRKDGSAGLNSPRAGAGRTNGSRNNHPTVKPTDLMKYLCRLITPPGGLVLDPFCGSGSTGKAAMLEGLRFVGVELNADYCQLAQRRIEAVTKQGLLFA